MEVFNLNIRHNNYIMEEDEYYKEVYKVWLIHFEHIEIFSINYDINKTVTVRLTNFCFIFIKSQNIYENIKSVLEDFDTICYYLQKYDIKYNNFGDYNLQLIYKDYYFNLRYNKKFNIVCSHIENNIEKYIYENIDIVNEDNLLEKINIILNGKYIIEKIKPMIKSAK